MRATERLYLDRGKTKAVPHGHPEAAFLLAHAGTDIPDDVALRYGIADGKLAQLADPKPDLSTPRNNVVPEAELPRRGPGRPPVKQP